MRMVVHHGQHRYRGRVTRKEDSRGMPSSSKVAGTPEVCHRFWKQVSNGSQDTFHLLP